MLRRIGTEETLMGVAASACLSWRLLIDGLVVSPFRTCPQPSNLEHKRRTGLKTLVVDHESFTQDCSFRTRKFIRQRPQAKAWEKQVAKAHDAEWL